MNTLYEILEVSENASKEVIEKAYRVLAKKYHPDLQTPENKQMAEAKMKQINEAYDILSDELKRKEYDEKLKAEKEAQNKAKEREFYQEENFSNANSNIAQSGASEQAERRVKDMQRRRYEQEMRRHQEQMKKQMEKEMRQQYENAYYNYLRSLGYKIKEKWTWQKTKKLCIILLVIIVIVIGLWFLPVTHNMMVSFYENNKIVKIIVDIVVGIGVAFVKTLQSMFGG